MNDFRMGATPPKKGRGCFFYGCLTVIVLLLLLGGLSVYLVHWGMGRMVDTLTTKTPLPVPTVLVSETVAEKSRAKFAEFTQAAAAGKAPPETSFSAEEINALIATHPDFSVLKERCFVELSGDAATVTFNAPLNVVAELLPFMSWLGADMNGRYVNGRATGSFSFEGDEIRAVVKELSLNGQVMNEPVLDGINKWLRENRVVKTDSPARETVTHVGSAAVSNGKIVIKGKE